MMGVAHGLVRGLDESTLNGGDGRRVSPVGRNRHLEGCSRRLPLGATRLLALARCAGPLAFDEIRDSFCHPALLTSAQSATRSGDVAN